MKTAKENALQEMKIAESNFLMALMGINPKDIYIQVHPEINTIAWIVGHLVSHMDAYLSIFTGERYFSDDQRKYFGYSSPKQSMKEGCPYSFKGIIENYFEISKNYFNQLGDLSAEDYNKIPPIEGFKETYFDLLHRISLHFMGHVGQIVLIRRMIKKPEIEPWQDNHGWSFVSGVSQIDRDNRFKKWMDWWIKAKEKFD